MKKIYLAIGLLSFVMASCTSPSSEKAAPEGKKIEQGKELLCNYSYQEATTEVLWVAYKYTEKTGVKGKFDKVLVEGAHDGTNPAEVLSGATFTIATNSVNSGDPTRDPKILESFFGTLSDGETIKGAVVAIEGNESSGTIRLSIELNGVAQEAEGSYTVTNDKFEAKVELNLENWNAQSAIAELNKVCEDLHKGSDGKSVLWPDVSVVISTTFGKTCE